MDKEFQKALFRAIGSLVELRLWNLIETRLFRSNAFAFRADFKDVWGGNRGDYEVYIVTRVTLHRHRYGFN